MIRIICLAVAALGVGVGLSGQTAPAVPSFEVVSIRVNTTNGVTDPVPRRSGNRITMRNTRLYYIVAYAYHIDGMSYQVSGSLDLPGPDDSNWFDIEAIAPDSPSDADVRLMFQSMLEDRFKLKAHRETREMGGFDLIVDKGGAKLKPSAPDVRAAVEGSSLPPATNWVFTSKAGARLLGRGSTTTQLAANLGNILRVPVWDRTGVTGIFDYDVPFVLNNNQADVNSAPALSTAVQEDLGLRLEANKGPVDVLVIDHLERPSEN